MFGITHFGFFVIAVFLLNVTPGPDTAYIVGRSIQLGWRGGVVAVLGIEAGCTLHVLAAAIGALAISACAAGLIPAQRAASTDPVKALRME